MTSMSSELEPNALNLTITVVRPDAGMRPQDSLEAREHGLHLLPRRGVRQSHRRREPHPVTQLERLETLVGQLAVRNAHHSPVECAEARRTQADVLDGADEVLDLDEVADAQRLVDGERHGTEDVLHGLLRAERQGQAADAEAGEHSADRVAHGRDHGQDAERHDRPPEDVGTHGQQAERGGIGPRPRPGQRQGREDGDRAPERPEQGKHQA